MFGALLGASLASGVASGAASSALSPGASSSPAVMAPAAPSFGSQIGSSLKDGVASGIGAIPGQALSANVGSRLAGRAHRNFQDGAFPGTTPFDRLSGSNGSSGSAGGPSDSVRVAHIQARGAEKVARINSSAPLSRENREASAGIAAAQGRKLRSESALNTSKRRLVELGVPRALADSRLADKLAAANLTAEQNKTLTGSVSNFMRRSGAISPEAMFKGLSSILDSVLDAPLRVHEKVVDRYHRREAARRLPPLPPPR